MFESGVFHDIPGNLVPQVKSILDAEITAIEGHPGSVLDKNKQVVSSVVSKLAPLRSQTNGVTEERRPVTADEISQQRRQTFGRNLEERQKEFTSLLAVKTPEAPEFSDQNNDKPIGTEMDQMVAEAMARRARDLEQVMNTQDRGVAEKWLTSESASPNGPDANDEVHTPPRATDRSDIRLTIGERLETPTVTSVAPKRVSFSNKPDTVTGSNESEGSDIFQRFKKTSDSTEQIIKDLKRLTADIEERSAQVRELITQLEETRK